MSTNVLDAFLITIGLDTSAYRKGEREVSDSFKKTREAGTKAFADIENRGKSATLTFRSLSNELAGMLLVFAGAKSVTDFASNMLAGESAAGRLSGNLGLGAPKLIAWQQVVKQLGGDAKDASVALQAMTNAQQNFGLTGSTGADADFRGLGITVNDLQNLDPSQLLLRIASAGEKMSKPEFANRLQRIGIPQSVIYTLEQGRKAVAAQVAEAEKLSHVTQQDIQAAQDFDRSLAKLRTTIEGDVRPQLTHLVKGMIALLDYSEQNADEMPSLNTALVGIGGVALAAGAPFIALGAAILLVTNNFDALVKRWHEFEALNTRMQDATNSIFDPLRKWLGLKTGAQAAKDGTDVFGNPLDGPLSGGSPGSAKARSAPGRSSPVQGSRAQQIMAFFQRHGVSEAVALGILAGMSAESRLDPNAVNPTSHAIGYGQWTQSRRDALFRRFGPHPTGLQQLEFMWWELTGGDPRASAVLKQTTTAGAWTAMIYDFYRPKPGPETWGDLGRAADYVKGMHASTGLRSVHIGTIQVHTNATDAKGIARDIGHELRRNGVIQSANNGLAP